MTPEQYLTVLGRIVGARKYADALAFAAKNGPAVAERMTQEQEAVAHGLMALVASPPSSDIWHYYDIQPFEHFPDAFETGERVSMTEKIHGTCCVAGIVGGRQVVTTKRLGNAGVLLHEEEDARYWVAARRERLHEKLAAWCAETGVADALLFGEIFGAGIQDLEYGMVAGGFAYRAFDLYYRVRQPDDGAIRLPFAYLAVDDFRDMAHSYGIPPVPEVYRGPFSLDVLAEHTSGRSMLADQMREGVVVKPLTERTVKDLGRLVLKSVSPEYRSRIGGTEFQ